MLITWPAIILLQAKNQPFKKDITFAQFYYLDKFILLTSGNSLYLYKYHIDTSTPDDITRYVVGVRSLFK